jgi:hypothetical protein
MLGGAAARRGPQIDSRRPPVVPRGPTGRPCSADSVPLLPVPPPSPSVAVHRQLLPAEARCQLTSVDFRNFSANHYSNFVHNTNDISEI